MPEIFQTFWVCNMWHQNLLNKSAEFWTKTVVDGSYFMVTNNTTMMSQTPYSSDMASFHFFCSQERSMKGCCFSSVHKTKSASLKGLNTYQRSSFWKVITEEHASYIIYWLDSFIKLCFYIICGYLMIWNIDQSIHSSIDNTLVLSFYNRFDI